MQVFYLFENSNGLEDIWEPQYYLQVGSAMFSDWWQNFKNPHTARYMKIDLAIIIFSLARSILNKRSLLS